ncbi:MAG: tannase/feruloyl esterase family alpha/beta hydrolase [Gammaproteobacteria bacterium]|nr:tannase/feruloyl esterase family alpha/beta hydrolase [Gammaproteobacteria bacterium]MDH4255761.1 tannase/feruloyl esterase family alpha/beta hydrolase [Gammaproteobacteria bacterium]MDH5308682.1 tannase/feruloyl esterase family alpha/beta hydrolase [Gammaproteobacteria bacterium]
MDRNTGTIRKPKSTDRHRSAGAVLLLASLSGLGPQAAAAGPGLADVSGRSPAEACTSLAGHSIPAEVIGLPTGGAMITAAELVSAAAAGNENGEFCRILGAIRPVSYTAPDINFEVNLPTAWNGKTLHFGGGGFNGRLVSGLTHYVKQPASERTPLARGYVTLGSDAGHQSATPFDGRFMLNDEALRNYGHEQIKKTHDVALRLIEVRYAAAPRFRYFVGGSQGGHEAFDAVQRYPDDYDGAVAGYPAHNLVMLHLSANRYARALHAGQGAGWISPAKARTFVSAVYEACDSLDGIGDGIIGNVSSCYEATAAFRRQDAANPLRCDGGSDTGTGCLSDRQIESLLVMDARYDLGFSVFADDEGNSVFPRWTPFEGSTFFDGGFPNLGGDGPQQALQFLPGDATPRYGIARNLALDTLADFDPTHYAGRIADLVTLISANSVDLDRFQASGGKLIFFHGAVDDFIPVYSSIQYFERLQRRYRADALHEFVRFYTIPGMGHTTGPFNARISTLDALEAWVERGIAPGELLAIDANDATAGRTRPVCRYPAWPRYDGEGDPDRAGNFTCVTD